VSEVRIAAEPRTEFGKGAARRTRRAGKVPAVLYGHGTDPRHISLPGHDLMLALKTPNVLLRVEGLDGGSELALPRDVQRDPLKGFLEHVDLLLVRRGEKVTVEIPIQLVGAIAPGGMLDQQLVQISLEAEATHLPSHVEIDIEGMGIGDVVHAKDLKLPEGATLEADEESLVLQVVAPTTEEELVGAPAEEEAVEAEEAEEGEEGETAEAEGEAEGESSE
jgi:large subunit ribosomal protein L25